MSDESIIEMSELEESSGTAPARKVSSSWNFLFLHVYNWKKTQGYQRPRIFNTFFFSICIQRLISDILKNKFVGDLQISDVKGDTYT